MIAREGHVMTRKFRLAGASCLLVAISLNVTSVAHAEAENNARYVFETRLDNDRGSFWNQIFRTRNPHQRREVLQERAQQLPPPAIRTVQIPVLIGIFR